MNGGDVWHNITVRDDEEYVKEFKESDYWVSRATSGVDFRAKNLEAFDAMEKFKAKAIKKSNLNRASLKWEKKINQ